MSKTLEQIKADALALTDGDRDKLIDELIEASVTGGVGADRGTIEFALQSRTNGPFIQIENPKAHFEERLRYYGEDMAQRNSHA